MIRSGVAHGQREDASEFGHAGTSESCLQMAQAAPAKNVEVPHGTLTTRVGDSLHETSKKPKHVQAKKMPSRLATGSWTPPGVL